MTELPEPLRLANWLEQSAGASSVYRDRAAAELRRMHRELQKLAQQQMQPCAGRNCGSTNPNLHSAECFEDYEKAMGMAQQAQQVVDSDEKAGAYMEARLWEFIDMAAAWPKASPDPRTWDHVMVYAPKPAQRQEPEQEPVAWGMWDTMLGKGNRMMMVRLDKGQDGCTVPLYTSPPAQRKPLTDEQISSLWDGHTVPVFGEIGINPIVFARAIEAAHGIKENT